MWCNRYLAHVLWGIEDVKNEAMGVGGTMCGEESTVRQNEANGGKNKIRSLCGEFRVQSSIYATRWEYWIFYTTPSPHIALFSREEAQQWKNAGKVNFFRKKIHTSVLSVETLAMPFHSSPLFIPCNSHQGKDTSSADRHHIPDKTKLRKFNQNIFQHDSITQLSMPQPTRTTTHPLTIIVQCQHIYDFHEEINLIKQQCSAWSAMSKNLIALIIYLNNSWHNITDDRINHDFLMPTVLCSCTHSPTQPYPKRCRKAHSQNNNWIPHHATAVFDDIYSSDVPSLYNGHLLVHWETSAINACLAPQWPRPIVGTWLEKQTPFHFLPWVEVIFTLIDLYNGAFECVMNSPNDFPSLLINHFSSTNSKSHHQPLQNKSPMAILLSASKICPVQYTEPHMVPSQNKGLF